MSDTGRNPRIIIIDHVQIDDELEAFKKEWNLLAETETLSKQPVFELSFSGKGKQKAQWKQELSNVKRRR